MNAIISSIATKISSFRKEESPTLLCKINDQLAICLVDEGSVINCCSHSFAKKSGIPIESVQCSALGANKTPMTVVGVARYDIWATVIGPSNPCNLIVSKMIIIKDLGVDILLGQPAKIDNCIITIPHKSQIKFKAEDGIEYMVSYPLRKYDKIKLHAVMRVKTSATLLPGEKYSYQLPNHFIMQKKVMVTERPSKQPWIGGQILDIDNGCINIENKTPLPIYLKRHEHIADLSDA